MPGALQIASTRDYTTLAARTSRTSSTDLGVIRIHTELAMVPAARTLLALGRQDLDRQLIALSERDSRDDHHGGNVLGPRLSSTARVSAGAVIVTLASWLLPTTSVVARVFERLRDGLANLHDDCRTHRAVRPRPRQAHRARPSSQVHADRVTAQILGRELPDLLGGEAQDRGDHPHEIEEDRGEHRLRAAPARANRSRPSRDGP